METEVLIVGGGTAGIAAAVSAARAGAQVVLLESASSLGGMGSTALVHTFCGLYRLSEDGANAEFANVGFAQELVSRLQNADAAANQPVRMGKLEVLFHDPERFAMMSRQWLESLPAITPHLGTRLVGLTRHGPRQWTALAQRADASFEINAKVVVDASGDAVAAHLCGASTEMEASAKLQRSAMVVKLQGVSGSELIPEKRLRLALSIAKAVKAQELPTSALGAGFRTGLTQGELFLTLDLSDRLMEGAPYDPLDDHHLKELYAAAKMEVQRLVTWLAKSLEGWEQLTILAWPERLGVRESRRGVGVHRLEFEEWQKATFPDSIGYAAWPIELREKSTGPQWVYPPNTHRPQIPLRSLVSRNAHDLLFAGRCVSCSHEVLGSLRVMGTCAVTGEAAGFAAAILSKDSKSSVTQDWKALAQRIQAWKDSS